MSDLDALTDRLADMVLEKVLAKLDGTPPAVVDEVPLGGLMEVPTDQPTLSVVPDESPTVVVPPPFPRPRANPAPVRGVEEVKAVGAVAPISAPDPYYGSQIGGGSTRPNDDVLAMWFERDFAGPRAYTVPVELQTQIG